jgi:hypothetical protein
MKNKITGLLVCLTLATTVFAQTTATMDRSILVNTPFPLVEAKTLLNNKIVFPTVAKNKIIIVCVAFNDDGRPKSDTWVKDVATKYADTNIVFYEIPMIKNAPKLFRGAIEKGMRKGTDVKLHNNVANYYGSIKEYKKTLMMDDEDSCYTFLLDKNGVIQFCTEGKTTSENLKLLDDAIKLLTK